MEKFILTERATLFDPNMYIEFLFELKGNTSPLLLWQDIIKANEKIAFRIEQGELIRSFIIKSNNQTFILIMAHHLAGDGKSMVYFIEDFMNGLQGRELTPKPMVLFTKDTISQICKSSFCMKLYADGFNKKWQKSQKPFLIEDYYRL